MADLRISELPPLLGTDVEANDDIAVADYSASETRRLTTKALIQNGVKLIDDGSIPGAKLVPNSVTALEVGPNAITASELADNAVDTAAIQDSAVTDAKIADGIDGSKITDDTITANEIAPDAVTSSELADNAVDTAAIQDLAVTDAKIAAGIDGAKLTDGTVVDAKIVDIDGGKLFPDSVTSAEIAPDAITNSELADLSVDTAAIQDSAVINSKVATGTLTGDRLVADTITANEIAPEAITSSELADNSVDTAAIQALAVTDAKLASGIDGVKITDGTVTNAKLAAGIDGSKLIANTVTATEIAPDAITSSELADLSVDEAAVLDGAITNIKIASGIDGAKITDGTLTAAKINATALDRGLDKTSGSIGITNSVVAGLHSGISFDQQGLITGTSPVQPAELPIATSTTVGVSSYPADSGLSVSGVGTVTHADSVTAGTTSGITYSASGHITNAVVLQGSDLPLATNSVVGAVKVPGPVLALDGTGGIIHGDTAVAPGVYPKVTVTAQGHVTGGSELSPGDIPALDATILTTGKLDPERIDNLSIHREKLADYSISYIQEGQPDVFNICHIGCLWYQESSAQLRMWNGNSWMPVGFGRLSAENLRFCGTFDASTGNVLDVTTFGTTAGLISGDPIPTATDALSGVYLVCKTAGTYGADTYDGGDWTLCVGATEGWIRIDTLSGGGGSSTVRLDELLDVNITSPNAGDVLIYDSTTNKWINRSTNARKATFVEAFDSARTSFTMNVSADDVNNLLISVGGVIQEPGIDFSFTAPRTVSFTSAPSTGLAYWIIIEGVPSSGGGGGGGTSLPPGTAAEEYLQWDNSLGSWKPSSVLNGGSY